MDWEPDSLAARVQRAAEAAIAPTKCSTRVVMRSPLVVDVGGVAGQAAPTAGQVATAKAAAEAVNNAVLVKRYVSAIYNQLQALTATQKNNIWNDLISGTPPKYATSRGPNSGAIGVMWFLGANAGLGATATGQAKALAVALYVQDNPVYLINPPWDTSINVPGVSADGN